MTPFWLTAFIDLPAPVFGPAVRFWSEVTGYAVSAPRGEHREFASLVPPDADAHVKVQRLADGGPRIHLDLHVPDPQAAARQAQALGAELVADRGHVVVRSPGGLTACFVSHASSAAAGPVDRPGAGRSMLDQVCIDVPAAAHDSERDFWAAVLGRDPVPSATHPEFSRLMVPGQPLRILLQRLDESSGPVRAHLDLASDDRAGEVRRHATLGATLEAEHASWTVLRDPAGSAYCITDRTPGTPLG